MAAINYNDNRFQQVEAEKAQAIQNTENTYNQMINNTDVMYQKQIDATNKYAEEQKKNQQAQTDLAINQINQQKKELEQNYTREQKGAYTDYQKAIDNYGVEAEKRASAGLANSGYSESSKIASFTTYQNRYGLARQSFNNANVKYDNDINQAILANNSKLAEIAATAYQKSLEIALQGFQYKNTLIQNKVNQLNTIEDRFYNRYRDVVNQINTEREFDEKVRQYNEQMAWQKSQAAAKAASSGGSSRKSSRSSSRKSSGSSSKKSSNNYVALSNNDIQLSATAQKLAEKIDNNANAPGALGKLGRKLNNAFAKSSIVSAYDKNKITDKEADYLFQKGGW